MRLRRSSRDDRGVSVVVGTVLLIGMVTMAMAVLGAAVLSTDFIDSPPQAEFVYQEDGNGTVAIGLTDAQGLSASDTEIRLEGEGSCGTWYGSGTLEKGDITVLDDGDCPKSLEEGDVLQVISADTLLDTYEVKGIATGYDRCEKVIDGEDITVEEDETLDCDIVGEDGGRVDLEVVIKDGGKLIGDVHLSDDSNAGFDLKGGGTFTGNLDSKTMPTIRSGSRIDGDITVPQDNNGDTLALKGDTNMEGSIETTDEKVKLNENVTLEGDIIVHPVDGSGMDTGVDLQDEVLVNGDVNASQYDAEIADSANVTGDVIENK